jgi:hypothetical protein
MGAACIRSCLCRFCAVHDVWRAKELEMSSSGMNGIRLTPGAKALLDDAVQEVREEIIARASRNAADPYDEILEVSVRDVRTAIEDFQQAARATRRSQLLRRILTIYAIAGFSLALVAVSAFVVLILVSSSGTSRVADIGAAAAAALGMLLALFSIFFLFVDRQRREQAEVRTRFGLVKSPDDLVAEFIRAWLRLEAALRDAASTQLGESAAGLPLGNLLRGLGRSASLAPAEEAEILKLLRLRNEIVHGTKLSRPIDLAEQIARTLVLTQRLRRLVQPSTKPTPDAAP